VNLAVGSGSHAVQTAEIMLRLEPLLVERRPDVVLVYGDVNSTVAAAIVAAKLQIPLGHVEAGLRSGDRTMPEEINRILTDAVSDFLFTHSIDADEKLKAAGVRPDAIHFVGNCMIDTLIRLLPHAVRPDLPGLDDRFALVTIHRPSNVDDARRLEYILRSLAAISRFVRVVFPLHPRTRQRMPDGALSVPTAANLILTEPQGYLEFLWLQQHAAVVITDSGGVQEETTYLQIPCLTLRTSTERPVTVSCGTNLLVGDDPGRLEREVRTILDGGRKTGTIPPLWDGRAGERIAAILAQRAASVARAAP
jgi:UDP-N-acetylglucosamine 2-epimerase (non-hydrolysing)